MSTTMRWLLPVLIIVVVGGASFSIHRYIVSQNVEKGTPIATKRANEKKQMAQVNSQFDSLSKVLTTLKVMAERRPNDSMIVVNAANLAFDLEQWDVAEKFYTQFLEKVDPKSSSVRVDRAYTMSAQGRDEAAVKEIDQVLTSQPTFQMGLYYKAIILLKAGKVEDATTLIKKCLEVDKTTIYGQKADAILQRIRSST